MTVRTGLALLSLALSLAVDWMVAQGNRPASDSSRAGVTRIGLSLGTLKEKRWLRGREAFVQRAPEIGAEMLVQAGNSDGKRQIQDTEALMSRDVACLVVVTFNPTAMQKALESVKAAGVPIICYDRMITDGDADLDVSFDNIEVGQFQAPHLVDRLDGKGRIVSIHGPKTDHTGQLFKQGQDNVLEPPIASGAFQVVHEDCGAFSDCSTPDHFAIASDSPPPSQRTTLCHHLRDDPS